MNKYWYFFLLIALVSCQPEEVVVTGTPVAVIPPLEGEPIPVEMSALAANPAVYDGAYIQLSGEFTRLPQLVCESNAQPSPATWGLTKDTLMALAGGFDAQLRPLLPNKLMITVAGRWQHWEGLVGCGKNVQPKTIWYLAVSHVISPSPITQVTLTPENVSIAANGEGGNSDLTTVPPTPPPDELPGEEPAVSPIPSLDSATEQPTRLPTNLTVTATPTISGNEPGNTPTATTTPTSSPTNTLAPGVTPTIASTAPTDQATPTPSATFKPGETPTITPTIPPNATATNTPVFNNKDMGFLDPEELIYDFLQGEDRHLWTFSNEVGNNKLTVHAIAVATVDIAIQVTDPSGGLLIIQNSGGVGQFEMVNELAMPRIGDYVIEITAVNETGGGYLMMALDDFSFPIQFDTIAYGLPVTTQFNSEIEQLWVFMGKAGEIVAITADPNNTADIGIDFIGPDGEQLLVDDNDGNLLDLYGDGITEQVVGYSLPYTGLYTMWLYGFGDGIITTNLSLTKN